MDIKKYIICILFSLIIILYSNIVNAVYFTTLSEFKAYVHDSKGYLYVNKDDKDYEKQLKSLNTYLSGAKKNKNGNYEIVINTTDGKTETVGILTEAEWKSAKIWANDGLPDDEENYEDNIQYQKTQIYNDVNSMIGTLYSASTKDGKIDYNEYLDKLKEQLESVKNSNQYTGELQEYRISLYEKEIEKTDALISVKNKFEAESEGMTSEDIEERLRTLNSNLERYKNMSSNYVENGKSRDVLIAETEAMIELYEEIRSRNVINNNIYKYPNKIDGSTAGSLDDMIGDADSFLAKANSDVVTSASLQSFSQSFYNILLTVGIIVAVLVGLVIGIRFMVGGAEEKANVKELLNPYIVGCIVVFGAFSIWKIVVTILSEV